MMKTLEVLFVTILGLTSWLMASEPSPSIFADPPMEARPSAYWDWLNGNFDLKTLTSDLEQAKAKGMGGLEIWDVGVLNNPSMIPAGPAFLSDESVAGIRHALAEGQRRLPKAPPVVSPFGTRWRKANGLACASV